MQTFLTILLVLMMIATLGVLGAGIVGMIRGGNDPRRSNALMRYRVLFQAGAVLIFGLILWMMKP
ncbi:MAG: twin transmembrane helix small protein [Alphaproteobacteria bacterium]